MHVLLITSEWPVPGRQHTAHFVKRQVDFLTAAGIDVDANGHIFVCDLVNGRIVEISPTGKQLNATSVPWPDKVIASRKSGDCQ